MNAVWKSNLENTATIARISALRVVYPPFGPAVGHSRSLHRGDTHQHSTARPAGNAKPVLCPAKRGKHSQETRARHGAHEDQGREVFGWCGFDNGKVDSPKTSTHEHFDAKARQAFPVFARKRTAASRQESRRKGAEGGAIN